MAKDGSHACVPEAQHSRASPHVVRVPGVASLFVVIEMMALVMTATAAIDLVVASAVIMPEVVRIVTTLRTLLWLKDDGHSLPLQTPAP